MKRIKFTIAGTHPLLYDLRRHLIVEKKMQLVGLHESPDFVLLGADNPATELGPDLIKMVSEMTQLNQHTPILVLSSSCVYSDKTDLGEVSENKPMSEDRASVIPSVLDSSAPRALFTLTTENLVLRSFKHVLVLRTFETYGPEIDSGTIRKFLVQAKDLKKIQVEAPGYQTRTFLHMDDFLVAFDRLVPKFLKGARGIYNIGSTEEISLNRLADSVYQLTHPNGGDTPIELVQPKDRQVWWVQPDITRISALLNWKPQITVRKGLWTIVNEGQHGHHRQSVQLASQ